MPLHPRYDDIRKKIGEIEDRLVDVSGGLYDNDVPTMIKNMAAVINGAVDAYSLIGGIAHGGVIVGPANFSRLTVYPLAPEMDDELRDLLNTAKLVLINRAERLALPTPFDLEA